MQRRALLAFTAAAVAARPGLTLAAIKPAATDALLVIDVQNCFIPGGSLAVKDGDAIVPVINKLARAFANVVVTQDGHTADHISFASQHKGKKPFETTIVASPCRISIHG